MSSSVRWQNINISNLLYSVDTTEDLKEVEKMIKKDSLIYSYRIHNMEIG